MGHVSHVNHSDWHKAGLQLRATFIIIVLTVTMSRGTAGGQGELWKDSGTGTTIPGGADLGLVEKVLLTPSALFRESA